MFVFGLPPLQLSAEAMDRLPALVARLGGAPCTARLCRHAAPAAVRTAPAAGVRHSKTRHKSEQDTKVSIRLPALAARLGGAPRAVLVLVAAAVRTAPAAVARPTMCQAFQDSTQIGARNKGPLTGSCGPTGRRSARRSSVSTRGPRRHPHCPCRWRHSFQDSTQIGARNKGPLTGSCGPTGRRSARRSSGLPRRPRSRPHRPCRWRAR